jgi:hypothetical protein
MRYHADGEWPDIVEQAVRYCVENELEILVVDGWDKWSGVKDENDAVDVNKALGPLLAAAAAGLAVVIVAHQRKGGGQHGDAVRGSNAFTGAVDVILELQWATGELGEQGGRALYGNSRLMSTPEKLALIWDAETGIYTAGDLGEIEYAADKDRVVAALDTEERIQDEIADRVNGMRKERLTALLGELVDEKVAFRTGKGRKGSQFRWRRRTPEDDADEGEQTDTGEMGLSANGASEPEQNAVPATDSVPEVWERNIRLNHAGLSGSSDSVPTYREPGRERNSPRPETATQNGVPPIPNTHGDALPPSREWLARDGRWRSFTDEPPAFAGEVVDTR